MRAGKLVETAIKRLYDTAESAAEDYGTSHSLLSRQIDSVDKQHLSFQRLWSMPLAFRMELVEVLLADLQAHGAPVESETTYRIRKRAA